MASACGSNDGIIGEWETLISEADNIIVSTVFNEDGKYQNYVDTDHDKLLLSEGKYYCEKNEDNNSVGYVKIYDNQLNGDLDRVFRFRIQGEKYGVAAADSDLMDPIIHNGSIVFYKELEFEEYYNFQPGDRIVYMSQNYDDFGEIVTREIRRVTKTAEGDLGYVTYALSTDVDEKTIATPDYILGKYVGSIAFVCVNEKRLEYEIEDGMLTLQDDDTLIMYGDTHSTIYRR